MTAVSAMVLLLLGTAGVVAVLGVLTALGRGGDGIDLPARPPRKRSRHRAPDARRRT